MPEQTTDSRELVRSIALRYPPELQDYAQEDIARTTFHLDFVREHVPVGGSVCDIGGGYTLSSVCCAAAGYRSWVIDDFSDPVHHRLGEGPLRIHREYGVEIIKRDVVREGLDYAPASLDAFTCFDSMEHWHSSPRPVFRSAARALRPGGLFVISAPNAVNLRKRITVPLGYGKWTRMDQWYDAPVFRSHVREPDVDDLRYIARDLDLANVQILGRNWVGYANPSPAIRRITPLVDRLLQLRPSLCGDIYMLGFRKAPASAASAPGMTSGR
jgi:SAM-dependent methyltransferase